MHLSEVSLKVKGIRNAEQSTKEWKKRLQLKCAKVKGDHKNLSSWILY